MIGLRLCRRVPGQPSYGELRLYDGAAFVATRAFTQLDVETGRLRYARLASAAVADSFRFVVRNSRGETASPDTMTIVPNRLPVVEINRPLTVLAGGRRAITPEVLRVTDPDDPQGNWADQLRFTQVVAPSQGGLQLINQEGINYQTAYYEHAGAVAAGDDRAVLDVTDRHGGVVRLTLDIRVDRSGQNRAPTVVNSSVVAPRGNRVFTANDLSCTDDRSAPGEIVYTVAGGTQGSLGWVRQTALGPLIYPPLDLLDTFTQRDINEGRIGGYVGAGVTYRFIVRDADYASTGVVTFTASEP